MQLKVPEKNVADANSFPVAPAAVSRWLSQLKIPDSQTDVKDLYIGLKHSNRLQNDLSQRRQVIGNFIPALRSANDHLSEITYERALPLTPEFARAARLQDSLLREEALSFKILLRDSDTPSADDARRAMQALARQVEAIVHGYRHLPQPVIQDAHQLYAMAEEHQLLSALQGSQKTSLEDHYRFILLLSISGLNQQRLRQLPAVIDLLRQASQEIKIEHSRPERNAEKTIYAIDLEQGSRPEPATAILIDEADNVRWFDISPVLELIDKTSAGIEAGAAAGGKALERQSLVRLHTALTHSRDRRLARCISAEPKQVFIGHKEICAHFLYQFDDDSLSTQTTNWVEKNRSEHGVCLHHAGCRAGLVQVGELVSIKPMNTESLYPDSTQGNNVKATIGVIRWVLDRTSHGITIGVEFMTHTVMPVHVTRISSPSSTAGKSSARETALILACKIQDKEIQTMLLASNVYQSGDDLCAWQGKRSLNVRLGLALQANGLFSQFAMAGTRAKN